MKTLVWNLIALVAVLAACAVAKPALAEDKAAAGDNEPLKIELPEAFFGGTPLGAPLLGLAGDRFGAPWTLALGGVGVIVVAGTAALLLRRRAALAGDPEPGSPMLIRLSAEYSVVDFPLPVGPVTRKMPCGSDV